MSTYMAKKETLERKWYVIDAAGKPLGKPLSPPPTFSEESTVPNSHRTWTAASL